ncbi:MAG: PBP1A family penicillin-binding protein [Myxococcota bacterium]|nr:PBP1A family penicillin-binding protein [Myxococcota bacterium]
MSQRSKGKRRFKGLLFFLLFFVVFLSTALFFTYQHYAKDLPTFSINGSDRMPLLSRVYDRDGVVIGRFFEQRRTLVKAEHRPKLLIQAILAAEDADFYQHKGLDYSGILRALYNSLRAGRLKGGGSTITQQTVKNLLLSQEKSLRRKMREMILTWRVEGQLSKEEILTLYLNTIYLGHGRYGVREAASFYFDKEPHQLDLIEAATLAGLIQSPERHSPRKHPDSARRRRRYVLREMWENNFIDEASYRAADSATLTLPPPPQLPESPRWFMSALRSQLIEQYGEETLLRGGLEIHSTLSLRLQDQALAATQKGLRALDKRQRHPRPIRMLKTPTDRGRWRERARRRAEREMPRPGRWCEGLLLEVDEGQQRAHFDLGPSRGIVPLDLLDRAGAGIPKVGGVYALRVDEHQRRGEPLRLKPALPQSAVVVIEPQSRELLALVGGSSPDHFPYNRAFFAHRQPGSAFKPFVFGAALESRRFTAGSIVLDSPEVYSLPDGRQWSPQNYDRKYRGEVSFRDALARSLNTISVRATERVGLSAVRRFAEAAGLSGPFVENLTVALGSSEVSPIQLVNSYATIADDGRYQAPKLIRRIDGPNGPLALPEHEAARQAIDEKVNWLLRDMMRSVIDRGTGRGLRTLELPIAGKTGTSNDAKDAWFIGLLPRLVVGVWVGFDQPKKLGRREGGSKSALPIAREIFSQWKSTHVEALIEWPPPPEGILSLEIEPAHNKRAHEQSTETRSEYYLEGTEPIEEAPRADHVSSDDFLFGDE